MPLYSFDTRHVELRGAHHYIAPDATVLGSVILENDASIWFNVVIRADNDRIHVGAGTNVQDGSVLHVDPGYPLTLGSRVSIGDGTLIGINSVVLNGARIGRGCLIGANSLITEGKAIPDGVLVLGSPGKVVRELSADERANLLRIADGYVERARRFKTQLRAQPLPESAR